VDGGHCAAREGQERRVVRLEVEGEDVEQLADYLDERTVKVTM
jgi:hypothetical protein